MTKAIFFDLDNCLSPADENGRDFYRPALDAIREANRGTLGEEALEAALEDCWRYPLDQVAEIHGFSPAMLAAGWEASSRIEVREPRSGYADLPLLRELDARLFLVTSGFRRLQESKIRALGFRDWFEEVFIDAIDEPDRPGKRGIFETILESRRLEPAEALVVGDSEASEIEAGNRLGIPTVQILRPGVPEGSLATWRIRSLAELKDLLERDASRRGA